MFILKVIHTDSDATYLKDNVAWVGPYETYQLADNGKTRIEDCNPDDYTATIMELNDVADEYRPHSVDESGTPRTSLPGEFLSELYFTHMF